MSWPASAGEIGGLLQQEAVGVVIIEEGEYVLGIGEQEVVAEMVVYVVEAERHSGCSIRHSLG